MPALTDVPRSSEEWRAFLQSRVAGFGRILAAFVRGRRSRSLYGETFAPLLDRTVADVRAGFIGADERANTRDVVAFVATALLAVVVGLAFSAVMLPFVPVGLVASWLRRRQGGTNMTA